MLITRNLDDYIVRLSKLSGYLREDITEVGPLFRKWYAGDPVAQVVTWREALTHCILLAQLGRPMPWDECTCQGCHCALTLTE